MPTVLGPLRSARFTLKPNPQTLNQVPCRRRNQGGVSLRDAAAEAERGSTKGELFGSITSRADFTDLLLRIQRTSAAARFASERGPGAAEEPSANRAKVSGREGGGGKGGSSNRKQERLAFDLDADGPGSSAKRQVRPQT